MKIEELVGEWFLPESNFKLSGKLLIDPKKRRVELVLYGKHYIEESEIEIGMSRDNEVYFHDVILGETTFDSITIINCKLRQTKLLGLDFYEIKYIGSIVLRGAHILNKDNLKIRKALLIFPYLSSWYDGQESSFKSDKYEKGLVQDTSSSGLIDVTQDLKFNFIDNYHKQDLKFGISYEVNFEKLLEFQYSNNSSFERVLSDAVQFSKLLEFSIRKKVQFKVISITVSSSHLSKIDRKRAGKEYTRLPITYFGSYTSDEFLDKDGHQNVMLFSKWIVSKDNLNAIIQKWYSNKNLFHIYDYYLDSNNWFEGTGAVLTNVMFNNRFLNLVQALESYHKKLDISYATNIEYYNNQKEKIEELLKEDLNLADWFTDYVKPPPDNFTLRERLESLLKRLEPVIKPLLGDDFFSSFPKQAKDYRHKLSHGDLDGTNLGKPLIKLFYEAQFILALLIMESLDFSQKDILRLVELNQNCIGDINEMIHNKEIKE